MPGVDITHDPRWRSWVASAGSTSDFPLQNLPFGVVAGATGDTEFDAPHGVVRIGDAVLDLGGLAASGLLSGDAQAAAEAAADGTLNALFALGSGPRVALRKTLHSLLVEGGTAPADCRGAAHPGVRSRRCAARPNR
jgi:fumarylacetoacetase